MALGPAGLVWLGLNLGDTAGYPGPLPWLGLNLPRTGLNTRSPTTGEITFVGNVPTITGVGLPKVPTTGVVTFTGNVSVVVNSARILPNTGLVTFTGNQPSATWSILQRKTEHELPTHWHSDVGWAARYAFIPVGVQPQNRASVQALAPEPTTGEVTFTGYVPTVISAAFYTMPTTGEVEFNGGIPVLTLPVAGVSPTTGVFTFTGNVADLNTQKLSQPHTGDVTFTGYVPYVDAAPAVTPTSSEFFFYGNSPTVDTQEQIIIPGNDLVDSVITFSGNAPTLTGAVVGGGRNHAGRSHRHHHHHHGRKLVTIDGEDFEVESEEEAAALLESVKELAVEKSKSDAAAEVTQRLKAETANIDTSPVDLPMPLVDSEDAAFKAAVDAVISDAYKRAEIEAEVAVRLAKQRLLDEEDNLVLLLLNQ